MIYNIHMISNIHMNKNLPFFLDCELSSTYVGDRIYYQCKEVEKLC